jgi:NDP-sugar pyrophosphorylase family protein
VSYPFDGYWLDIGNHSDYEKALEEYEHIKGNLHLVPRHDESDG